MTRKRKATLKSVKIQRKGRFGSLKSRQAFRQIFVKVPGGKTVVHYKKKKPGKAVCGECGAVLQGVVRERPYRMRKMAKTMKKPTRAFGGMLCSRCARKKIIQEARR
jgi:large subunit ribosomal protein L34e